MNNLFHWLKQKRQERYERKMRQILSIVAGLYSEGKAHIYSHDSFPQEVKADNPYRQEEE